MKRARQCRRRTTTRLPASDGVSSGVLLVLQRDGARVDGFLQDTLAAMGDAPPRLVEAMGYSLFAGGKRLRPTLVLECAAAIQNPKPKTRNPGAPPATALGAAAAIELIHTFSLVHDDLPAMDDDDLRRGRPTSHKVFGEAMAILAGDAMVALAFELLARQSEPDLVAPLTAELASATGPAGMIGGQVLDMQSQNTSLSLDGLRDVHRRKTGALLTAACRMGAIAARADARQLAALTAYGQSLGLAFQIVDDMLDVTATVADLGKTTKKDASRGKTTFPSLLGIDGSRRAAEEALAAALGALRPLGSGAQVLGELARFVVSRRS